MENTDIAPLRQAELAALLFCACEYSKRCAAPRQRVARILKLEPSECVVRAQYQAGSVNPTSREDVSVPF